jgi:Glycosyltransferase sugar-binding region containing DXD motif
VAIPKIIVQTHRDPAIGVSERRTWQQMNPEFEYRFFTDAECVKFLQQSMPGLVSIYHKLPKAVQKADLFRYAYIYFHGGVYADVDTICEAPLSSYIDFDQEAMVVGVEMTPAAYKFGLLQYTQQYISPFQVLQWAFAASPKHLALGVMLDRIRFYVDSFSVEQLQSWSRVDRFTLEVTGPMMFSQVIHDFLSGSRNAKVTLLDQLCWGYNPWHNRAVELPDDRIKLRHLFHGSWKQANESLANS